MNKTLDISFNNPNSNTTDHCISIADTEANIEVFAGGTGKNMAQYIEYLEGKSFTSVNFDELEDGEYTIWERPKHRPRN